MNNESGDRGTKRRFFAPFDRDDELKNQYTRIPKVTVAIHVVVDDENKVTNRLL